MAIYLTKKHTNLTNREIGNTFMISPTVAIKAARNIEGLMAENKEKQKRVESVVSVFSA
ncbi:MAG: hypothetical protein M0R20_02825 [Candidatus Omnitrophica bacterium]|nr:hypothetical protein [Candidatus Omnitrophota bacterium]